MFDAVRNNKRIVQVFLLLIALPFAFWGVDSYVRGDGAGGSVAAVGDSKITLQQFQQAWREQLDRMRNSLGPNFNQAVFDTPEGRRAMLDQMINQRLLMLEANRLHLAAGNQQLQQVIASVPSLQENGRFSHEKYEAMVRAQGYTIEGFEAQLRQDLTMQQISDAVAETAIGSRAAGTALLAALTAQRQVAEARLRPEDFLAQVSLTDDELQKHYEATKQEYEEPEQARVAFVVLSPEALKAQASVTADEVRKWYDSHLDRYVQPEERRASHILITVDASAPAAEKEKAKARAEEVLKQVKARPGDFGALARQHSQDPGSAEKNGDLGFFGRGAMVKAFEDAVFGLKEGEVSGVVQSDFGFHIIKLTGINPGKQKRFEEVRAEIEAELKQQGVQRKYAEAAESFVNTVYEQSDSLQGAAENFKLPIQETGWIAKGRPVEQPGSPFANPKLLAAVFADEAVKNKRNTEAVEIAPNTLVAARVLEHKPAAVRPFAAVRGEVRNRLAIRRAGELATKAGAEKLAAYQAGKEGGASFAAPLVVSRLAPGALPPAAIEAVFKADPAKLPAYVGMPGSGGGYSLYKIVGVADALKLDERQAGALRGEFLKILAQEELRAYLSSLRSRYKVDVNTAALEAK